MKRKIHFLSHSIFIVIVKNSRRNTKDEEVNRKKGKRKSRRSRVKECGGKLMHELFMMYMLVSINGAIRLSLCVEKRKKEINFL